MHTRSELRVRSLRTACALALIAGASHAQTFIETNGQLVALSGAATPGLAGAVWAGNGAFDTPVIDESGRVFFRGQFVGGGATGANDRAMFFGPAGGLAMMTRNGDQAPGMPAGITVNTSAGAGGLTSLYRLSPSGSCVFMPNVWNGGVTTTTDTAVYGGTPSAPLLLGREGDPAPGTVGATLSSNFTTAVTLNVLSATSNGNVCWRSLLTGGDVVGSTNNEAMYIYDAGTSTSQLLIRRGDLLPGGFALGLMVGPATPYVLHMNDAGQVLWEAQLNTTIGSPLPTAADNQLLVLSTLSGGHTIIAREGDVAPGTGGDMYGAASNLSTWAATGNCFTPAGDIYFKSDLKGAGTTTGVNDQGVFHKPASGAISLIVRRGDVAPGLGGPVINTVTNASMNLNSNGQYLFTATLSGGGVTTANDGSVWYGNANTPGSLTLLAREGDAAPGTTGALLGSATTVLQNDSNTVVLLYTLTGGDVVGTTNNGALYRWTAATGLQMLVRTGSTWTQMPGETISSFSFNALPNTNGANLSLSQAGRLVTRLGLVSTGQAVAILDVGSTPSTSFCLGDGTGAACPCANTGAAGRGCASMAFPGGARLSSGGIAGASIGTDSLVLTASDIPGPGLFFQSTGLAGSPINFGDGHLCAAVGIVRLGVVFPTGGAASYPGGLTPNPIHIAGGTANGDTRHYQCWYRSVPGLCDPQNFNLTQGLTLVWGP